MLSALQDFLIIAARQSIGFTESQWALTTHIYAHLVAMERLSENGKEEGLKEN